jgi:hypothetical protein
VYSKEALIALAGCLRYNASLTVLAFTIFANNLALSCVCIEVRYIEKVNALRYLILVLAVALNSVATCAVALLRGRLFSALELNWSYRGIPTVLL